MSRIESTNDFVVKFANINGSGSASANELFARAILRMGVPVSPRNIFPSNIQGMPTWYELRVCEAGWLGRRGGVDLMVAMNPQTWAQDLQEIEPGGYLFYDSTKPPESLRDDVHAIGMPVTAICNGTYEDPRQRTLYKNIMVIGALAELMSVELAVVEQLLAEQYKGKERLLDGNVRALKAGASFAREHLAEANATGRARAFAPPSASGEPGGWPSPVGLKVRRADRVGAAHLHGGQRRQPALGMVYGGATVCAWYPITPSTSVAEAFAGYCKQVPRRPRGPRTYAIVQAEDETRLHRHGGGRGLERRARLHRHVGPGRVADDRVPRLGLLRRDPGHAHQRAARRPLHRHAHAHPAGRSAFLRLRLARRHQARAAVPRGPARVLRAFRPPRWTWPTACRRRCSS
jgi:2-oxoglutarate ferredoxin oxidoreductase subunit alpha